MKPAFLLSRRACVIIAIAAAGLTAGTILTGCKTTPQKTEQQKEEISIADLVPPVPITPDTLNIDLEKYQFRATWVSTINNLDFTRAESGESFISNFINVLNTCETFNLNAVIFQVSPMLDAYWPSQHRPWSQFLLSNGRQGTGPAGWDPLSIMVEETHKHGMEFHAWMNPYRVTASQHTAAQDADIQALIAALNADELLSDDNFAVLNPAFVYSYDRKLYLDAGYPEVRQHVIDTVAEIIKNYDVDAIHFDDYFYPYNASGSAYDQETFDLYRGDFTDRYEWRRNNNDLLIRGVKDAIAAENQASGRAIQFGVSPFGIWANSRIPGGSATSGNQTYTGGVYADTRKWILEEMVDYMCPQIYWYIGQPGADYSVLAPWWANLVENKNVHLYIGHANYKYTHPGFMWPNAGEILNQILLNEAIPEIRGSSFFSYTYMNVTAETGAGTPVLIASNNLLKDHWNYQTTIPPKPWLDSIAPDAPKNPVRQIGGNTITWTDTEGSNSRYYAVYRVTTETLTGGSYTPADVINDPTKIIGKVWRIGAQPYLFIDTTTQYPGEYTYIVTAFNAAHVESEPVVVVKNEGSRNGNSR